MKDFSTLFELGHKISVYVPGTLHDVPAPELQEEKTTELIKTFSEMFGGCTVNPVIGGFYSHQLEKVITEKINICFSYCNDEQITRNAANVISICRELCKAMKQECICMEFDGKVAFINL